MHRREYLAVVGGAAIGLSGCTSDGGRDTSPTPTVSGSVHDPLLNRSAIRRQFETVVDAVKGGCDPSGESDCAAAIERLARPGRVVRFPSGTYRLEKPVDLTDQGPIGVVGADGASIAPVQGFNDMALTVKAPSVYVENLEIDIDRPKTSAGITVAADDEFFISDVTYRGRGDNTGPSNPFAFNLSIRKSGGSGVAKRLTAKHGAAIGHYNSGGGRGGIWIGPINVGTIRVEDCHLEEFANNGIYGSRSKGDVQVVGGTYRNNNVTSIRIGGKGSFVRDARIEVDMSTYDGPRTKMDSVFATRGIVVEQGPVTDSKPPGAEVSGCTIDLVDSSGPGAGISLWSTGRTLTVSKTKITVGIDGYKGLFRAGRNPLGSRPPSSFPRHVTLEDVTIESRAKDVTGLDLIDAPNSTLRNCRIDQRKPSTPGLRLIRSPQLSVDGGSIRAFGPLALIEKYGDVGPDSCLLHVSGVTPSKASTSDEQSSKLRHVDTCLSPSQLAGLSGRSLAIYRLQGNRITYGASK